MTHKKPDVLDYWTQFLFVLCLCCMLGPRNAGGATCTSSEHHRGAGKCQYYIIQQIYYSYIVLNNKEMQMWFNFWDLICINDQLTI